MIQWKDYRNRKQENFVLLLPLIFKTRFINLIELLTTLTMFFIYKSVGVGD
jgi:hypothetical protein